MHWKVFNCKDDIRSNRSNNLFKVAGGNVNSILRSENEISRGDRSMLFEIVKAFVCIKSCVYIDIWSWNCEFGSLSSSIFFDWTIINGVTSRANVNCVGSSVAYYCRISNLIVSNCWGRIWYDSVSKAIVLSNYLKSKKVLMSTIINI